MRLQLDENLGRPAVKLFEEAGLEVATVHQQSMASAIDSELATRAASEQRCLVTLDLDFANVLLFPPRSYCGIAVLRLPSRPSSKDLFAACSTLIAGLSRAEISGQLWIVEPGRIREYEPDDDDLDSGL
jgi:hypothetical protein